MSHISVMKIGFADRELLTAALADLGYTIREGEDLKISDGKRSFKVDFLVNIPDTDPVGFRHGKNGWQLTADWFRVNLNRKNFENRLKQQYAYRAVMKSLQEQGYTLSEETRDAEQRIHLVLRRVS